jgi:hypothetical protein
MAVALHNGPVKGLELIKGLPADGELGKLSLGTCDAHRPAPTARDARRSSNSLQSGSRAGRATTGTAILGKTVGRVGMRLRAMGMLNLVTWLVCSSSV